MTLKIEFPQGTELLQIEELFLKDSEIPEACKKLVEIDGFFESVFQPAQDRDSTSHVSSDTKFPEDINKIEQNVNSLGEAANKNKHAAYLQRQGLLPEDYNRGADQAVEFIIENIIKYDLGVPLRRLPQNWVCDFLANSPRPHRLKRDHGVYRLIGNFLYRRLKEVSHGAECIDELKDIHDQRFNLVTVKKVVREIENHSCFDRSADAFKADLSISAYNELKRLDVEGITSDATTSSRQPTAKVYQTLGILLDLNDFITLGDIKNSPQEWTGVRAGELKALSKNLIDDGTVSLSDIKRVVNLLKLAICHLIGLIPSHMIFRVL